MSLRDWFAGRRSPAAEPSPDLATLATPMLTKAPSGQNVVDLFAGEWSSRFPAESGLVSGGDADLFADERVRWADRVLGPLAGLEVLELGPLEGGHSYMMHWLGARSVTAVEANPRAFLRLLCVKELLHLTTLTPLLGDCLPYLDTLGSRRFDMVFASGLLYTMTEPLRFLDRICETADRVFIWTHYYDPDFIEGGPDDGNFEAPSEVRLGDFTCVGVRRNYPEEILAKLAPGAAPYAIWLTRDGIADFLQDRGLTRIELGFDHPEHPNGPAIAFAAHRE